MTDALPLALDALDEVDWASLRHAYGRAEDVPAMLRAWTSTDPEEQAAGADDLFAAVFHQGDVTSAAGPCVPVFVAALRDERPDLWQHAAWYMYAAAVPQGMDPSAVADFHPADHNVPAAYANLSAAVPHLMTMIGNERYSDETRAALCATLAWCPEAPGHVVEGCWHALQRGAGPLLRPALLVLAGLALRRAGEVAADTTWLRASSAAFDETTAAAVGRALAGDP